MEDVDIKNKYSQYRRIKDVSIIVDYFQPVTMNHINAVKIMRRLLKLSKTIRVVLLLYVVQQGWVKLI